MAEATFRQIDVEGTLAVQKVVDDVVVGALAYHPNNNKVTRHYPVRDSDINTRCPVLDGSDCNYSVLDDGLATEVTSQSSTEGKYRVLERILRD